MQTPQTPTDAPLSLPPIEPPPDPATARDGALIRPDGAFDPGSRRALLASLDHSLSYLRSSRAVRDYARLAARGGGVPGATLGRVRDSAARLRRLLVVSPDGNAFRAAVAREFVFVVPAASTGADVLFTGYYEAFYPASARETAEYRYPLFAPLPGFARWPRPHPTRRELEGATGLAWRSGPLRDARPLAFLRDRLQAFLVQVQGSARLRLTDGRTRVIAYAAHTDRPYTGVGMELVRAGLIPREDLTLQTLIDRFRAHPEEMNIYLPRNQRFVFFRLAGADAVTRGSLGVPLTAERSIATDPAMLPPGAVALAQARLTNPAAARTLGTDVFTRYVLAQDVGGAIKGPRRVDIYMGGGPFAEGRAGALDSLGRLSFPLLR